MSTPQDTAERLLRLERIFADCTRSVHGSSARPDPVTMLVAGVMTERIQRTTSELQRRQAVPVDAIDAMTMRLLLTDYMQAVAHLRAVTRMSEQQLTSAANALKGGVRLVDRALDAARSSRESGPGTNGLARRDPASGPELS